MQQAANVVAITEKKHARKLNQKNRLKRNRIKENRLKKGSKEAADVREHKADKHSYTSL